jgi:HK97 family phage prohead protease
VESSEEFCMAVVIEETGRTEGEDRISEAPWDGSAGRFTDQQYERSCILDRKVCGGDWASAPPKTRCSLPVKEPGGELSRAGVHAAAARLNQVKNACPAAISSAKGKLRSAYKQLGEDAPDSLKSDELVPEPIDPYMAKYGIIPGVPRHNTEGCRGLIPCEFVRAEDARDEHNGIGLMHGHFAVFDRWTEIDSFFEGRFMERVLHGAFKKTFAENGDSIRVMFNHGRDPKVGMGLLGPARVLEEDQTGARYEVPLDDTSWNRDLLPGLKRGGYGASFRFRVIREEVTTKPGRSDYNPEGIEERSITEAAVSEFGPVSFPAYKEASASVRSTLYDELMQEMGGEAGYLRVTGPGQYHPYHFFFDVDELRAGAASDSPGHERGEEGSEEDGSSPDAQAGEHQAGDGEPALSEDAPDRDYLRSTRLPSAARKPLRTTKRLEVPSWKL